MLSCFVMSDSLRPQPARLLCLWSFPGKSTGVGCRLLLQGIFPTQGWNLQWTSWRHFLTFLWTDTIIGTKKLERLLTDMSGLVRRHELGQSLGDRRTGRHCALQAMWSQSQTWLSDWTAATTMGTVWLFNCFSFGTPSLLLLLLSRFSCV